MSEAVELTIPGKPVALSRTGHGQFGGRWLASSSSRQLGLIVAAWERAGEPRLPDDAPLEVQLRFYFERPASHFGTGRNAGILKPRFAGTEPTGRPDLDNLAKLAIEALQGNAYKDDSRIVFLVAGKAYSDRARTEIAVRPSTRTPNARPALAVAA